MNFHKQSGEADIATNIPHFTQTKQPPRSLPNHQRASRARQRVNINILRVMQFFLPLLLLRKKKVVSLHRFRERGRLAQLVQSVCLTSRGSAVRIRQRPHPINVLFLDLTAAAEAAFFICIPQFNRTSARCTSFIISCRMSISRPSPTLMADQQTRVRDRRHLWTATRTNRSRRRSDYTLHRPTFIGSLSVSVQAI